MLALPVLCPTSYAAPQQQYAFADVRGGRLRGRVNATTGVRSFLGVRYAQPPLNDLRWREPLPERNWTGVRDALNFGDVCLQNPLFGWNSIENRGNMSEDCLYLNVVAPPPRPKPYPVMVYIHAGEFHFGSGADRESDEPHFADDVVLVSFNYRLGVFGFLASDDLRDRTAYGGTGNYGVHDQRAALRWVQHNIGAFGGDASNVILWGESSGGTSVALHLVSPRSHRLFHKAILESPGITQVKGLADAELNYKYTLAALLSQQSAGCVAAGGYATFTETRLDGRHAIAAATNVTLAAARGACNANASCHAFTLTRLNDAVMPAKFNATFHSRVYPIFDQRARLGAAATTKPQFATYVRAAQEGEAGVACLLNASAQALVNATDFVPRDDDFETNGFAPVVDGNDMPQSIVEQVVEGRFSPGVPVLIGSNLDEGTIFMELSPPLPCADATNASFAAWAEAMYGEETAAAVVPAYQQLRAPLPKCAHHHGAAPAAVDACIPEGGDCTEARDSCCPQVPPLPPLKCLLDRAGGPMTCDRVQPAMAADPDPTAIPGYWYMAAMRSAGDYAITCRVRQMAAALQKRHHKVYAYYFTTSRHGTPHPTPRSSLYRCTLTTSPTSRTRRSTTTSCRRSAPSTAPRCPSRSTTPSSWPPPRSARCRRRWAATGATLRTPATPTAGRGPASAAPRRRTGPSLPPRRTRRRCSSTRKPSRRSSA